MSDSSWGRVMTERLAIPRNSCLTQGVVGHYFTCVSCVPLLAVMS